MDTWTILARRAVGRRPMSMADMARVLGVQELALRKELVGNQTDTAPFDFWETGAGSPDHRITSVVIAHFKDAVAWVRRARMPETVTASEEKLARLEALLVERTLADDDG